MNMEEQIKSLGRNYWKVGFFVLLFLLIIVANIFAWYFFVKSKAPTPTPSPAGFESTPPTATIIPTSTPKETILPLPTPTPKVDETGLIKQAIFKLTGLDATKAEVTINKNTGKHATGGIKEFEAVGGAYWLAAKTGETWVGVYAGQAQPTCSQIAPYNFPKEMVPECLDASGKVVSR